MLLFLSQVLSSEATKMRTGCVVSLNLEYVGKDLYPACKKCLKISKGVIRRHKSKNTQYIHQEKRNKRTNNDLQNTTDKTKDRAARTSFTTG